MKKVIVFLSAICFFAWSCNNAGKDSETTTDSSGRTTLDSGNNNSMSDSNNSTSTPPIVADPATAAFLPEAADGGMAEVQQGQIAQQKGNTQAVKDFGAMMVHDHSAANDRLKALATQRNVTLPDSVSSKHKQMMQNLNKKSGKEFDRFYINEMVKDHQEDIKEFEQAANKVGDLEVKAFINNTLPTLKTHLDSAKAIQKRIK
jgi:putative membrane protein